MESLPADHRIDHDSSKLKEVVSAILAAGLLKRANTFDCAHVNRDNDSEDSPGIHFKFTEFGKRRSKISFNINQEGQISVRAFPNRLCESEPAGYGYLEEIIRATIPNPHDDLTATVQQSVEQIRGTIDLYATTTPMHDYGPLLDLWRLTEPTLIDTPKEKHQPSEAERKEKQWRKKVHALLHSENRTFKSTIYDYTIADEDLETEEVVRCVLRHNLLKGADSFHLKHQRTHCGKEGPCPAIHLDLYESESRLNLLSFLFYQNGHISLSAVPSRFSEYQWTGILEAKNQSPTDTLAELVEHSTEFVRDTLDLYSTTDPRLDYKPLLEIWRPLNPVIIDKPKEDELPAEQSQDEEPPSPWWKIW